MSQKVSRLRLSYLQKIALLVAMNDSQGAYSYKPFRVAFGYGKSSISRSARRLEQGGLIERDTHHSAITCFGASVVRGAMLRPSIGWLVAMESVSHYVRVARAMRGTRASRRAARITAQIVARYRQGK